MKIRIKGNSVRFRLTKTEVSEFAAHGIVEDGTTFSKSTFSYALKAKADISQLEADYTNNTIIIYFPEKYQKKWATNNVVGYNNNVAWNEKGALSLLVEKDFTCLDNTNEDQSDNYPNPKLK